MGRRIPKYWTPKFQEEKKLELFHDTIIFLSLDQMKEQIVFRENCNPTMLYDELTQELFKAQLTLDILNSVSPKSNICRRTNTYLTYMYTLS